MHYIDFKVENSAMAVFLIFSESKENQQNKYINAIEEAIMFAQIKTNNSKEVLLSL